MSGHLCTGRDETVSALEDLLQLCDRAGLSCVAMRLYLADGAWCECVIGGTPEERKSAEADLRATLGEAH